MALRNHGLLSTGNFVTEPHDTQPEFYSATILEMALKNTGILPQKTYKRLILTDMLQRGITHMRKQEIQMGSMLELLARIRTYKALDSAVTKSRNYCSALKRQNKAFAALDNAGLSKELRLIVDRTITATDECGAAYGETAYRLGFCDNSRLVSELRKINNK